MIEFNGYISGNAEKHFRKKGIILGLKIIYGGLMLWLPIVVILFFDTKNWLIPGLYCAMFMLCTILALISKSKKERLSLTPKRIFTDGDFIVCVTDENTESRLIADAKQIRDFGEFYEIVFPFGKLSEKFICQKNLLSKGTLEQFEALFEGKIERVNRR